jgi:K+-transporting ATPase ATPase A chain
MSGASWLQFAVLVALVGIGTPLLGGYMAKVFGGGKAPGDRIFRPVERCVYRMTGVDPDREQRWAVYAASLLAFSLCSVLALLRAAAGAGLAAAQPDRRRGRPARPLVQHRGELRHQLQLAELRR